MKRLSFILLFLICSYISAQNEITPELVNDLKQQIKQSESLEKLELLDSLCWITRDKPEFKYDSIVKATVNFAIELDSFNIANRQAARLIWSLTNRMGKPEEGKAYYEEFEALQLPVTDDALLARFYLNGGDSYYFSGDVEKSINVYDIASKHAIQSKDSILYGISKKYIADAYARLGNLVEASRMLQEVEELYINTKDTIRLVNTKSSRADLYSMNGFFVEAKIERDEAIALSKSAKYYSGLLSALYNAAIDNSKEGNHKERIKNLKQALQYARGSELEDQYVPQLLNKLLTSYSQVDSLDKATEILKDIQSDPDRYTKGLFEDMHVQGLAYYYLAKKDYPKALRHAKQYYESQAASNSFENTMGAHELLFNIYEAQNDNDKALYHYKEFTKANDSILSLKKTQALSYYQTLYETEKRDAKIASQESEITILDAKNKVKQQWMLFGGIGLLTIFLIIYLTRTRAFARNKQKLLERFSQNLINEQEKERKRISMELHDSVGQKLMLLTKKTKEKNDDAMESLAEGTLEELRSISRGLHPAVLNRFGFGKAVNALVDELDNNSDILFTLDMQNVDDLISKEASIHLYRIIQESLNNILKHSKAKAVSIDIERKGEQIMTKIEDNGQGFNVSDAFGKVTSLGMKTLKERAKIIRSQLYIDSIVDRGTIVNITTPINV
ncbi:ATP-binding protein [Winogradskyella sp. 3972H.M.0a.05]|uniref:ATP-binding protein n=1 Tax=Winogradskyella sp. 3972H.M.0a.05 TaxID=2950277 RepID=UPI00339306A8